MQLSTMLSTVALVFACGAFVFSMRAYIFCKKNAVRELSKRWRAEIETAVTDLSDAVDSYERSLKKLRARIGMRASREKNANGADPDMPDPVTEPDAWKRAMRLRLRSQGKL